MNRRRRIVRVEIDGRTYAYRATHRLTRGDVVRVHARLNGELTRPVIGFGRHGHVGPLKSAYPVPSPAKSGVEFPPRPIRGR